MTRLVSILVLLMVLGGTWQLLRYWDKSVEEHQAAEKAAAAHEQSLQNLPGLPYELLPSLQAAQRQGSKAMRAWLKAYGTSVQDPRKAWIELDYCGLIFRDDPNEAKRVFAGVKKRTPPSSPVWPRMQELQKTYE